MQTPPTHTTSKAQVGLGNVDNTSDLNKPISTATQTALDLKADKSTTYTKTETDTLLGAKQDTISDLSTIRSNAQAGKTASDTIATYGNIVTHNVSEFATATQGAKADTAVQPSDLATVATSGSYNDLSNKPTIPTVNNPTITFTQGGVTKGSFTLNQATDDTIALDAGGGSSVVIDNSTITKNADQEIQVVAVIDQNTGIVKTWTGTIAEYDAIATKDPETEYIITDDIGGPATVIAELAEGLNGKADVSTVAHVVTEFQAPTAENGYTWYRKYADGWVEQGGAVLGLTDWASITITLPVPMRDRGYSYIQSPIMYSAGGSGPWEVGVTAKTETQVSSRFFANNGFFPTWEVKGMAAQQ